MISALPSELSEIGRRDALRAEAEQLFAEVDEDGSGTLDAEEVQQLASRLGLKLDRVAAKEAMDVMDADGGGDARSVRGRHVGAEVRQVLQIYSFADHKTTH